jgi:hypothetical protein
VELIIEKLNEFDTNSNKNGYNEYRSQQKPPYNGRSHNQQTLLIREKSSNSMDPWARRNPI